LSESDQRALRRELDSTAAADALEHVQQILDRYCLAGVTINPESRVKIAQGPAKPELVEQGWRLFLVKVQNEAGVTAELQAVSPNAKSLFEGGWSNSAADKYFKGKSDAPRGESDP